MERRGGKRKGYNSRLRVQGSMELTTENRRRFLAKGEGVRDRSTTTKGDTVVFSPQAGPCHSSRLCFEDTCFLSFFISFFFSLGGERELRGKT